MTAEMCTAAHAWGERLEASTDEEFGIWLCMTIYGWGRLFLPELRQQYNVILARDPAILPLSGKC